MKTLLIALMIPLMTLAPSPKKEQKFNFVLDLFEQGVSTIR